MIIKKLKKWRDRLFRIVTCMGPKLKSGIYLLEALLAPGEKGFRSQFMLNGSTRRLPMLACHASALNQDQPPHPPHAHREEEILLLVSGKLDLIIPDEKNGNGEKRLRIKPRQALYYPEYFEHTIQAIGDHPASYVMFKWYTDTTERDAPREFGQFDLFGPEKDADVKEGFSPRCVFEGPTTRLKKLRCHTSTLTPGASYAPHADDYDVMIIVLEGEVETLGQRVGPRSIIYYAAGKPHGMHNPGQKTAKYVVFEFHGRKFVILRRLFKRFRALINKLIRG